MFFFILIIIIFMTRAAKTTSCESVLVRKKHNNYGPNTYIVERKWNEEKNSKVIWDKNVKFN